MQATSMAAILQLQIALFRRQVRVLFLQLPLSSWPTLCTNVHKHIGVLWNLHCVVAEVCICVLACVCVCTILCGSGVHLMEIRTVCKCHGI